MNVNFIFLVELSKIVLMVKSSVVSMDVVVMEFFGGFFVQLYVFIFGSKIVLDVFVISVIQIEGDIEVLVNIEVVLEVDSDVVLMVEMDDVLFSVSEVEVVSEEGLLVDVIKFVQKVLLLEKGEVIFIKVVLVK